MRIASIAILSVLALAMIPAPVSAEETVTVTTTTTIEGVVGCSTALRTPVVGVAPRDVCGTSTFDLTFPANTTAVSVHLEWDQVASPVDDLQLTWTTFLREDVEGASPLAYDYQTIDGPASGWTVEGQVRAASGSVAVQTPFTLTVTVTSVA